MDEAKHIELTTLRKVAYNELFGGEPVAFFGHDQFQKSSDVPYYVDVLVYKIAKEDRVVAAVTNGMSNYRMVEGDRPNQPRRREIIQYFRDCSAGHARRLFEMAWLPLFDGFLLDSYHSIAWEYPAIQGTPWKNAFFVEPIIRSHRDFVFNLDGDRASFLWHIPISDTERKFKLEHGSNEFLDLMEEKN